MYFTVSNIVVLLLLTHGGGYIDAIDVLQWKVLIILSWNKWRIAETLFLLVLLGCCSCCMMPHVTFWYDKICEFVTSWHPLEVTIGMCKQSIFNVRSFTAAKFDLHWKYQTIFATHEKPIVYYQILIRSILCSLTYSRDFGRKFSFALTSSFTGWFSERILQHICWKSYMKISIFPRGASFTFFQNGPYLM